MKNALLQHRSHMLGSRYKQTKISNTQERRTACYSVIKVTVGMQLLRETHQEMIDSNVASLYFGTSLAFNAHDGGPPLGRSP